MTPNLISVKSEKCWHLPSIIAVFSVVTKIVYLDNVQCRKVDELRAVIVSIYSQLLVAQLSCFECTVLPAVHCFSKTTRVA